MKVLVIGAGGMLGYTTYQYLKEQGHLVTGVTKTKRIPGMIKLDATNKVALENFLNENPFDVIINCAALLVAPSEHRKAEAVRLNSWLPHYLEGFYMEKGTYLIQVSTDGVFSGVEKAYREEGPSDADTFYGKSKFLGELHNSKDLTVRSGFWGPDINEDGTGLFHWFMKQEGMVSGYSKAIFNGVSNLEFAKFSHAAMQNRWSGVYHLCASDAISKLDFLALLKKTFLQDVTLIPDEGLCVTRLLKNTRDDIGYGEKSFEQMVYELKSWISQKEYFSLYKR